MPEESRKFMSETKLGSFDGGERLRPRGNGFLICLFPEVRTFLLLHNGVFMISSDLHDSFWAYFA